MLLEYFRIEWFKKLAEIKDPLNGYSKELNALENFASAKTPGTQSKDYEFGELSDWINDNWMIQWLKSDPSLKGCDLRHYFFFARERLSAISAATSRMTPLAQEILSQLLSVGDAEYKIGISSANKISEADRMAILEELFAKATCEDNEVKRTRFLETIVLWSNNYESLSSQTIAFLKKFPVNFIPIKLVLLLLDPNSAYVQKGLSKELVRNWSDCDNTKLAKIAKKRLEEKSN
jgi:hypothetical protein